jgi:hypothetical protein
MNWDWTGKKPRELALLENARRQLFPTPRHQVIPSAFQGATDSGDGSDKQVDFARLNSPHASRIDVHKFGQSLLGHAQGRADAANVAAKFAQIGGNFSFNHPILRGNLTIDIKGVIRPNRGERPVSEFENARRRIKREHHFTRLALERH